MFSTFGKQCVLRFCFFTLVAVNVGYFTFSINICDVFKIELHTVNFKIVVLINSVDIITVSYLKQVVAPR